MSNVQHSDGPIEVTVNYAAAEDALKNSAVPATETIGSFRARVLNAFELSDGTTPDGNSVLYVLFHARTPLENMQQTIGEIAGPSRHLHLKLAQQITQG